MLIKIFVQVSCDKPNFTTVLKDMSSAGLARGMSQIQGGLDKKVKRKKVSQLDAERNIASVIPALDYSDFNKVGHFTFFIHIELQSNTPGGHGH